MKCHDCTEYTRKIFCTCSRWVLLSQVTCHVTILGRTCLAGVSLNYSAFCITFYYYLQHLPPLAFLLLMGLPRPSTFILPCSRGSSRRSFWSWKEESTEEKKLAHIWTSLLIHFRKLDGIDNSLCPQVHHVEAFLFNPNPSTRCTYNTPCYHVYVSGWVFALLRKGFEGLGLRKIFNFFFYFFRLEHKFCNGSEHFLHIYVILSWGLKKSNSHLISEPPCIFC